jgi:subtilisin family serine protease
LYRLVAVVVGVLVSFAFLPAGGAANTTAAAKRYTVVLAGTATQNGFSLTGQKDAVLALVSSAGGTVTNDMSAEIGVLAVESENGLFDETVRSSALVEAAAEEFVWKALPNRSDAAPVDPGGGPDSTEDPLEPLQWSMMQIRAPQAHAIQAGSRLVEVGILDSGIDSAHPDFADTDGSNVTCAKGKDFVPAGPGIGLPTPCLDNGFHGTHVAGIVGARANEVGVVGVSPNVELIPVKVCDTAGYCYSNATAAGIRYAGQMRFEVINMSFFVDDDVFLGSTEFKCMSDPQQRAFRLANERAIQYARSQGVTPVAALGNSDEDLAHPAAGNDCEVVPAETEGVIGTMALGRQSQKASYSSYGTGATDVAAPGGSGQTGNCTNTVLSTFPTYLGSYGCIQGTSMASPHAAGVAALIVSEFGTLGSDGDVKMSPSQVEQYLQSTTVDIGLAGYDECFGNGRIDAVRAVLHQTSRLYDAAAPFCPEYNE